ncbi:hypothetical protein H9657_02120 [Cellulomonas sp. Sa3CUA2]|uniref:Mycothiol-dependent maleylpyruvate isomerase metal-binding domain-containing protein n=1 Tax=Cellulomonas avistercoris TaxID=2762242 RepID=A0ABR8Q9I6_9CELL|nr:hypothetical protein [Cellulomonas avistercoris]MBD7917078.1 hypothetical protein [Cellulomonas avistercoris]
MTTSARDAYARGADVAVDLVTSEQVANAWGRPSVLAGMSVGELAAHTEDLAVSLGSDVRAPAPTLEVAVDVLVGAARRRHGDGEVLHALARRERDASEALRVL